MSLCFQKNEHPVQTLRDDLEVEVDTRINKLEEDVAALISDYKIIRGISHNLQDVVTQQQEKLDSSVAGIEANPVFDVHSYNHSDLTDISKQYS